MDSVDPSLFADLIFQWHEAPFCTLTEEEATEEHPPGDHHTMDSISDLPMITLSEGPPPHTRLCDLSAPQRGSENDVVKFPLVVEEGVTLDFAGEVIPAVSPPYTPPGAAGRHTKRSSKSGAKGKGLEAPAKSRRSICLPVMMDGEASRPPTQAEHIIRERQRRDDMTAKYHILESLLPPVPKRERAAVVEDATLLVQELQRKKAQLLKQRAQLKLVQKSITTVPSSHESPLSSYLEGRHEETDLRSSTSAISVCVAGKDCILVEMMWKQPPPKFLSILLQAVENLGVEVTRCSVARVAAQGSFVQCSMTCSKPNVPKQVNKEAILAPESVIVGALRTVLTELS